MIGGFVNGPVVGGIVADDDAFFHWGFLLGGFMRAVEQVIADPSSSRKWLFSQ